MERLWLLSDENPFAERPTSALRQLSFGASGLVLILALIAGQIHGLDPGFSLLLMGVGAVVGTPAILRKRTELLLSVRAMRAVPLVPIAELGGTEARRIVRVRGVVRARESAAPASGSDEAAVWRRADIYVSSIMVGPGAKRYSFYHDLAERFDVVDDLGRAVGVDVTTARLLARPTGQRATVASGDHATAAPWPEWIKKQLGTCGVEVRHLLVRDGDRVEVAGALAHEPDPDAGGVGRGGGTRPVLVAGKQALVIRPLAAVTPAR